MFEAVVDAAERLLLQHGSESLTTNRVAEIAGVSVGSLYQYFPNKEAIVAALFDRYLARYETLFDAAVEGATSIDDAIMRVTFALVADYQKHPDIFRYLWRMRSLADAHDRIAMSLAHMVRAVEQLFVRLDVATAAEAPMLAFAAIHAADGIANAFANRKVDIDAVQLGILFRDMVQGALAGAAARRR